MNDYFVLNFIIRKIDNKIINIIKTNTAVNVLFWILDIRLK